MDRDIDTLYMDYLDLMNIQTYITRDGMSYLDALTVAATHLHAVGLSGIVNVVVNSGDNEKHGDLIKHLEATLREYNNKA